jgi:hypothetical protein
MAAPQGLLQRLHRNDRRRGRQQRRKGIPGTLTVIIALLIVTLAGIAYLVPQKTGLRCSVGSDRCTNLTFTENFLEQRRDLRGWIAALSF